MKQYFRIPLLLPTSLVFGASEGTAQPQGTMVRSAGFSFTPDLNLGSG